jgi:hypothetical protein
MSARKGFAIAGLLFCIGGLLAVLGKNFPAAAMLFILGMTFLVLAQAQH